MAVHIKGLRFRYPTERFELAIDQLQIPTAQPTAIIGPSGCGKTTLLRLIAGILRPDSGEVRVLDQDVTQFNERQIRGFRLQHIGLVFQEFHLLDYLTAVDNILLPFRMSSTLKMSDDTKSLMNDLAKRTDISHLLEAYPNRLSQGERQRVALCRALVTQPRIVLADEPTGSLDPANQERIVTLLRSSAEAAGAGLIMVTHDHELLEHFERVIDLPALIEQPA